ncbi:MAG: type II secretion system major pseudopilin GspG [Gammaproteobacteria bacterium]|nr:type II secretion system major pseudopilin GspG [Gammaproteobacteria bacterium]MBU1482925.1 type II secretion system major pseudopilin GspG [Gammaproteobacteria bacterium]
MNKPSNKEYQLTAKTRVRQPNMSGFTLLELLVVMVIIGLLAAYVGPKYFSQIGKSETKTAMAQINALGKALDQYRLDVGHYPGTEAGLAALFAKPQGEAKWDGPYLQKNVPPDPWGKPYVYRQPGEHGDYDLLSYGKDGQPGGSSEAADITNW